MPIMIKTLKEQYMKENLDLFNWTLTPEEKAQLDNHIVPIPPNPVDVCLATGNHSSLRETANTAS